MSKAIKDCSWSYWMNITPPGLRSLRCLLDTGPKLRNDALVRKPAQSFSMLMENLQAINWNRCRITASDAILEKLTEASEWQQQALSMLGEFEQLRTKVQ